MFAEKTFKNRFIARHLVRYFVTEFNRESEFRLFYAIETFNRFSRYARVVKKNGVYAVKFHSKWNDFEMSDMCEAFARFLKSEKAQTFIATDNYIAKKLGKNSININVMTKRAEEKEELFDENDSVDFNKLNASYESFMNMIGQ